jgi:hypothetical protein
VWRIKSIMLPAPSTKSTNPAGTSAGTTEEWTLHAKGIEGEWRMWCWRQGVSDLWIVEVDVCT